MAEEDLKTDEEGGKKKSKLMLIIIIAVVVLLGGGAGAYFFLMGGEESAAEGEAASSASADGSMPENKGQAIYVAMPRPFQFNSPGVARERLVQIEVQLMVRGLENSDRAKSHIPMIESNLLQVFSAASADDLVTEQGKKNLREKSTAQVRQVMNDLEGNPLVEQVLFTGFVIQ
ncbi:flagellar basal body-associated protein FliL [Agaribacter marinus]|uniref:Flagellar protein FliL n=1 Tax=Agaribacter marinus TaxID=1431249 RepID=A0AA37SYC1_9ALTE|nr:flagellar basal body-associated protein FliL [Agaribacter marinus]GLR70724.1 flagellar basal body-associated protein FliL [Agaribacter marinus]